MKRQLLYLLAILCVAWFMPNVALGHDFLVDGIYYNITSSEDKTVEVTFEGENYADSNEYDGYVSIPSTVLYDGKTYNVTSIGTNAFRYNKTLTNVTISQSVTTIGEYAFYDCSRLNSITIPNSIVSIGQNAFNGCTCLTSITLPNSVREIGDFAFYKCTDLTSITIPNKITTLSKYLFGYCSNLTEVNIPQSVSVIGEKAFSNCENLSSINIPNSVTKIEQYAFDSCNNLQSIAIPDGVTSLSKYTFIYCKKLASVELPDGLTTIEDAAFMNCEQLTNLKIPNSVVSIGASAFRECSKLASIEIPQGVTIISKNTFTQCSSLQSVTIPSSVKTIGSDAFSWCNALKKVIVKDIAAWCKVSFSGTISNPLNKAGHLYSDESTEITILIIPEGVTSINKNVFWGCTGLTSCIISNSVKTIGEQAFRDCKGLTSITMGNNVESIAKRAFDGCEGLEKVIVKDIAAWCKISFNSSEGNPLHFAKHLYSDENTEIKNLIIPEGVTALNSKTFYNCISLTSCIIGNDVSTIGPSVFENCSNLEKLTIGESVKSIGSMAFASCPGLSTVYCNANQYPTTNTDVFQGSNIENATLFVLSSFVNQYTDSEPWKNFKEIKWTLVDQTLNLESLPLLTYGSSEYVLPTATNEGQTITWIVDNPNVAVINGNTLSVKNAGSTTIKAYQGGNEKYKPLSRDYLLTISKALLKITADNQTIIQGELIPLLTIHYDGFKYDDDESCISKQPVVTTTATKDSPAGTYSISAFGAEADNYEFEYYDGVLTILLREEQHLSLNKISTLNYGDASYTLPATTSEGLSLTWEVADNTIATVENGKIIAKKAGSTTITATQAGNENYNPFSQEFTLTINKAKLTITANDAVKYTGEVNPEFTVTYEGFKYDDDESSLTVKPTITTTATTDSPAGNYPIIVSGAESDNYEITYINGVLKVDKASTEQFTNPSPIHQGIVIADINGDGKMEKLEKLTKNNYYGYGNVYEYNYPAGVERLRNGVYRKMMFDKDGSDEDVYFSDYYKCYRKDRHYYYGLPYEISSGNGLLPNRNPAWTDKYRENTTDYSTYYNYDDIAYAYYEITSQEELNYLIGSTSEPQLYVKSSETINRKTYKYFGIDFYNNYSYSDFKFFCTYIYKENEIYVRKMQNSTITEVIVTYGKLFVKRDGQIYIVFTPSTDYPYLSFKREPDFVEDTNSAYKYYFRIENQEDLNYFVGTITNNVSFAISQYSESEPYEGSIDYVNGTLYKRFKTKSSLVNSYNGYYWVDMNGKVVSEEITGLDDNINLSNYKVDDLNNDGIPDFVNGPYKSYWVGTWNIYMSHGNTYSKQSFEVDKISETKTYNTNAIVDINHDGLKDLVYANGTVFETYIQQKDGTFMCQDVKLITDEKELEDALLKQEQDNKNSTFSVRGGGAISSAWGMFVQARSFNGDFILDDDFETDSNGVSMPRKSIVGPTSSNTSSDSAYEVIDMNNDGFPDLINTSGGISYISLANGSYYPAQLNGKAAIADLDGDGQKDIVVFDKANSKVLLEMCQPDGSFKETKLLDNGSISAIYCNDLNGDGKIDIMLQVPTTNYTVVVFYKNNGNGTFKKTERSLDYKGTYDFLSQPLDLNNNGIPSMLAARPDQKIKKLGREYPCVKRIDWDYNFNITESYIVSDGDTLRHDLTGNYADPYYSIYDYDGDGLLDIPVQKKTGKWYIQYIPSLFTINRLPNSIPAQLNKPDAVIDPVRGLLKIEWQEGNDEQSASGDLSYEIRVGKTDGTNDMMQDNAGRSSTFMVNIGSWPLGDYYISMRAIDPNGMKGDWSSSAKVSHTTPTANFFIDKHYMSTADTLIVSMTGDFDYIFDVQPEGRVVSQKDGKARIVFADCGKKTITAKIDGGNSIIDEVTVEPYRLKSYNYADINSEFIYIDLDLDGKTEALSNGYKGICVYEDGKYKDLETLFNSDLTIGEQSFAVDYNMDGLPDIYGNISKAGVNSERWMVNQGDLDFEIVDEQLTTRDDSHNTYRPKDCTRVDLDNDGLMDYVYKWNVFHNLGDGQFENIQLPVLQGFTYSGWDYDLKWSDLDNDGLLDFVAMINAENLELYTCRNKGNMNFEIMDSLYISHYVNSTRIERFVNVTDVNHDVYPDIVYWSSNTSGYASVGTSTAFYIPQTLILGNKQMKLEGGTVINLTPLNADYDNDGNLEFAYNDSIAFKRGEIYEKYANANKYYIGTYYEGTALDAVSQILQDVNNDGVVENIPPIGSESTGAKVYGFSYTNSTPTAPTSVHVNQTDSTIVVSWNGATDKETPLTLLRYNLSVKEKGATGENSYIISPMNGTSDIAKTMDLNNHQYRYATRFPIPFERFKAGKTYEIQVQTIDLWNEHSPFSQKVEFKPAAKALVSIPEKGGINIPVEFAYINNTGTTPTINAGDGIVEGNTITWSTPGLKTVTVTAGALRNTRQIMILDKPSFDLDVVSRALVESTISIDIPENLRSLATPINLTGSKGLTIRYQTNDDKATLVMPKNDGTYQLIVGYEDEIYGKLTKAYNIEVVGARFKPTIKMVSVENGMNKVHWDAQMELPDASLFNGKVKIYRETSISDNYMLIGETDLSTGGFVDETSRPNVKSDRYKITLGTIYGTESNPSIVHGTIHLMVNSSVGNNINLHWIPYEGANIVQYIILAGTSPNDLYEIDRVSGHSVSYTHERSSNETTYYVVAYRTKGDLADARGMRATRSANDNCESNIVCSDGAYNVRMVTNIEIRSVEEEQMLDENQPELHLNAVVTPALATLSSVEWSIIEGAEFATIDRDGTMVFIPTSTGGFVTVQARAIDGSGVSQTIEIPVSPVANNIIPGDANGDGEVNVSDIVEIVNYIMNNPSERFVFAAADVSEDTEVNVTDIVRVVSIIMTANNAKAFGTVSTATESTIYDRLQLKANVDHSLSLCLENETGYVASQFDLVLSSGQTLEGITLNNERRNGHTLTYSQTGTNTYRVVVYSLENQRYNDNNGELLNIAVSGRGSITIEDILFVTQNQEEKRFAPLYSETTGIGVIDQSDNLQNGDWYDLQGRKIVNPSRGRVTTGIYIINGKKYVVK